MQRLGPCNGGPKVKKAKDPWRSDCNCKYSYPTIPQLGSSSGPTDRLSAKGYTEYRPHDINYSNIRMDGEWYHILSIGYGLPQSEFVLHVQDTPCTP